MFELSFSIQINKQRYLAQLNKNLCAEIKADGGIITRHNNAGRSYIVIAGPKYKKEYYKSKILDILVSIIINNYKYEFFKNYLDLDNNKLLHQLFLKSVIIFDYDLDKEFIKSKIEIIDEICIDSFFFFKLQELKSKWERTAYLIKQNNIALSDESIFEIIKKLIDVTENRVLKVDIFANKKNIKMKNANTKKLFKNNKSGHIKLLEEIIRNNPQKINFTVSQNITDFDELIEILQGVFRDKIYLQT